MAASLASSAIDTHAAGNRLHTVHIRASGPSGARFSAGGSQLRPHASLSGRNGHGAIGAGTRAAGVRITATAVADIKVRTQRLPGRDAVPRCQAYVAQQLTVMRLVNCRQLPPGGLHHRNGAHLVCLYVCFFPAYIVAAVC